MTAWTPEPWKAKPQQSQPSHPAIGEACVLPVDTGSSGDSQSLTLAAYTAENATEH